jgi:hypothetical protein
MRRSLTLLFALSIIAGCNGGKTPIEPGADDFSELVSLDEKSDAFSYRMKLLGSLSYGQTSSDLKYTSTPRFRAYKFAGHKGDQVDIRVRSSNGGDALSWLVNNSFDVLAQNDDSDGSLDSHITATLPGNSNPDIVTYYVIYRDYDLKQKKFSVELQGKADYFSCERDSDCVAVSARMCCPNCSLAAVNKDQVEAYQNEPMICPAVLCPLACINDQRVAQCNTGSKTCEMIEIADIKCGGFTLNPHSCPPGYECQGPQLAWDAPGSCVAIPPPGQTCGGIANLQCPAGQICVEDPTDSCDPQNGGADCGGVCKDEICSGATARCAAGYRWSQWECTCVVDNSPPNPNPTSDCRALGCATGSWCSFCWGTFQCIPEGALC